MARIEDLFRKNLSRLMKTKGLTSGEVARRSGMLPQNFSKYLKGHMAPSLSTLQSIASALDVSATDLLAENSAHVHFAKEEANELFADVVKKFVIFEGLTRSESAQLLMLVHEFGGWTRLLAYLNEDKILKKRGAIHYKAVRDAIVKELGARSGSEHRVERKAK